MRYRTRSRCDPFSLCCIKQFYPLPFYICVKRIYVHPLIKMLLILDYRLDIQIIIHVKIIGHTRQFMAVFFYVRSEEHTSELQSRFDLVCRLLLEKKKQKTPITKYLMLNIK